MPPGTAMVPNLKWKKILYVHKKRNIIPPPPKKKTKWTTRKQWVKRLITLRYLFLHWQNISSAFCTFQLLPDSVEPDGEQFARIFCQYFLLWVLVSLCCRWWFSTSFPLLICFQLCFNLFNHQILLQWLLLFHSMFKLF